MMHAGDLNIKSIVVLRALQLGDMLCSVPALRALRAAFPRAHIALVGLPNAADFVRRFSHYIDELLCFPGMCGFPEQIPREDLLADFFSATGRRHFDLALQLHGSGRLSCRVTSLLGARVWAGFVPERSQSLPGWRMYWPDDLPEPLRYMGLMRHIGIPDKGAWLELPLLPGESSSARSLLEETGLAPGKTVLVHPGARLPSRRWPADRFAAVIDALAAGGWDIALTGTGADSGVVRRVLDKCKAAPVSLCGKTSLGELAALMQMCRLLIANDTGVSHVAAATGTPSIIIACGSDAGRWAPLDRQRHQVLHADLSCRPCMYVQCPYGHGCATAISADRVSELADRVLCN